MPATTVTSLCFAGPERDQLIVVTADNTDDASRAGTVFRLLADDVGATGLPRTRWPRSEPHDRRNCPLCVMIGRAPASLQVAPCYQERGPPWASRVRYRVLADRRRRRRQPRRDLPLRRAGPDCASARLTVSEVAAPSLHGACPRATHPPTGARDHRRLLVGPPARRVSSPQGRFAAGAAALDGGRLDASRPTASTSSTTGPPATCCTCTSACSAGSSPSGDAAGRRSARSGCG